MRRIPTFFQALLGAVPFVCYALVFQDDAQRIPGAAFQDPFGNHDSGLSYWILPLFALSITADVVMRIVVLRETWSKSDTFGSVAMGLAGAFCAAGLKLVQWGVFVWAYQHGPFAQGNSIWDWAVCFMAGEYLGYWFHRWGHEINFLWAAHFTHHSSQHFNIAIGIRNNVLHLFYKFYLWVPLCWLGFHPVMVITTDVVSNMYQFFIHVGWIGRIGWLDHILNTPSNHRVHHACNPQYLDKNFGGTFMLYDKLFGTFQLESEPPKYGLTDQWTSNNPIALIGRQWQLIGRNLRHSRGKNWRLVLFGKPAAQPRWNQDNDAKG